jgi:hypothetical protein
MSKPALFTLTFALLGLAPLAHATPPDRCSILDEYGHPSQCAPIGWRDAPYWDGEVCCDDDTCVETSRYGCSAGMEPYYCEYAELDARSRVQCMYIVPDYCDQNPCSPAPEYGWYSSAMNICCEDDGPCWPHDWNDGGCPGNIFLCVDGVCNDDGTITCYSTPE